MAAAAAPSGLCSDIDLRGCIPSDRLTFRVSILGRRRYATLVLKVEKFCRVSGVVQVGDDRLSHAFAACALFMRARSRAPQYSAVFALKAAAASEVYAALTSCIRRAGRVDG